MSASPPLGGAASGPTPLVSVEWLAAHVGDPDLRVVDTRWYLAARRGADEYAKGHLPGAVFADLDRDLAAPRGSGPGRHPLPSADDFASTLARLGIGDRTTVVAYDDAGGAIAARLWWLLRYFGHAGGRVLDGGIGAWVRAGHALSTEETIATPVPAPKLAPGAVGVVDKRAVDAARGRAGIVILDARAADRYEGKSEPIDARPGHVPSARSAPFAENLVAAGAEMKSREELQRRYEALGATAAERVICYCGSGVTACHDLLALAVVGREDALLYEGSWSDWAADQELPAAVGPDEG